MCGSGPTRRWCTWLDREAPSPRRCTLSLLWLPHHERPSLWPSRWRPASSRTASGSVWFEAPPRVSSFRSCRPSLPYPHSWRCSRTARCSVGSPVRRCRSRPSGSNSCELRSRSPPPGGPSEWRCWLGSDCPPMPPSSGCSPERLPCGVAPRRPARPRRVGVAGPEAAAPPPCTVSRPGSPVADGG